jgi:2-haloacid dehalogenase
MKITTVIVDLGGVLVDWSPEYLYLDIFNGDQTKMRWFLDNICTSEWNEMQDAGRPIEEATEILVNKYPDYENLIRLYYQDWEKMLAGPIQESVNILTKIKNLKDYRLLALTNWSAETFPIAQRKFEFLDDFEGIVVSGIEKTRKPYQKYMIYS